MDGGLSCLSLRTDCGDFRSRRKPVLKADVHGLVGEPHLDS